MDKIEFKLEIRGAAFYGYGELIYLWERGNLKTFAFNIIHAIECSQVMPTKTFGKMMGFEFDDEHNKWVRIGSGWFGMPSSWFPEGMYGLPSLDNKEE